MKTIIDYTEYCNRAVSTDKGRYNLISAFREANRLCGTDGHRLHLANDLPTATPHYLNSDLDIDSAPCIDAVLPKSLTAVASFRFSKKEIARLRKLATLIPTGQEASILFTFAANNLRINFTTPELSFEYNFACKEIARLRKLATLIPEVGNPYSVKINLEYFIDALIVDHDQVFNAYSLVEKGAPIAITCDNLMAIIMPLR
jgi:hypothetical protein